MHSLASFTAVTASLTTLANAIPLGHAPKHAYLHAPRAVDTEPQVIKRAPLLAVREAAKVPLDVYGGTCGGSTGFGCGQGLCCSQWGYCGQGPLYCGDAPALNGTAPNAAGDSSPAVNAAEYDGKGQDRPQQGAGAPSPASSIELSSYTPQAAPPADSSPPETSAAPAPATSPGVPAPAPNSYAPQSSPLESAPSPYKADPSSSSSSGSQGLGDVYKMYSGDGAASSGWPTEDQWASFEDSWTANEPMIKISCSQFGQEDPSDQEASDVKSAIESVASESGVDSRFILAVMMQESKGCVRAPTTTWSHDNPGLFQSFKGTGTCNPDGTGVVPCPASTIKQMVKDGVEGTASGPGLKQNLAECPSAGSSQGFYEAARIYNAGSLSDGNLGAVGATACYCSDVANRLTGWATADSACTLG